MGAGTALTAVRVSTKLLKNALRSERRRRRRMQQADEMSLKCVHSHTLINDIAYNSRRICSVRCGAVARENRRTSAQFSPIRNRFALARPAYGNRSIGNRFAWHRNHTRNMLSSRIDSDMKRFSSRARRPSCARDVGIVSRRATNVAVGRAFSVAISPFFGQKYPPAMRGAREKRAHAKKKRRFAVNFNSEASACESKSVFAARGSINRACSIRMECSHQTAGTAAEASRTKPKLRNQHTHASSVNPSASDDTAEMPRRVISAARSFPPARSALAALHLGA